MREQLEFRNDADSTHVGILHEAFNLILRVEPAGGAVLRLGELRKSLALDTKAVD